MVVDCTIRRDIALRLLQKLRRRCPSAPAESSDAFLQARNALGVSAAQEPAGPDIPVDERDARRRNKG